MGSAQVCAPSLGADAPRVTQAGERAGGTCPSEHSAGRRVLEKPFALPYFIPTPARPCVWVGEEKGRQASPEPLSCGSPWPGDVSITEHLQPLIDGGLGKTLQRIIIVTT